MLNVCKFCGCVASFDEPNCLSVEQAYEQTEQRPFGCPWFDDLSRARFERRTVLSEGGERHE